MMKYKGYIGKVSYDAKAKIFHGEIIGLKDVITFQGTTAPKIEKAFRDSIDVYLKFCKDLGEKPEKTFSGKLNLRMPTELHAHLVIEAQQQGISLNELINTKLIQAKKQ